MKLLKNKFPEDLPILVSPFHIKKNYMQILEVILEM